MVGKTVESVDPVLLAGILKIEGFLTVEAQPLGGDLVLISLYEGEDLETFLIHAKQWISAVFSFFFPWSEELVVGFRDVWLRCYGLPLHAWNVALFEKLANHFGSLLPMEFDSALKLSFGPCWLRVRTNCCRVIDQTLVVRVDGKDFSVHVKEVVSREVGPVEQHRYRLPSVVKQLDDEYDSDNSLGWLSDMGGLKDWLEEEGDLSLEKNGGDYSSANMVLKGGLKVVSAEENGGSSEKKDGKVGDDIIAINGVIPPRDVSLEMEGVEFNVGSR
ncbi:unnamed protein product [Lupinus luteus]|uniref:DUF4283 domain-containing protein n=1 Tax=Lupinus luteus TaxID=3873 RepID=A0AAV1WNB4_LUPLU